MLDRNCEKDPRMAILLKRDGIKKILKHTLLFFCTKIIDSIFHGNWPKRLDLTANKTQKTTAIFKQDGNKKILTHRIIAPPLYQER